MSRAAIAVRPGAPHDEDAICACVEAAFSLRFAPGWRERLGQAVESGATRVAVVEGEVVGVVSLVSVELTLPGAATLEAGALTWAAVLPTDRRRGVLSALMASVLEEARSIGLAALTLYASEGGIYRRFGFGVATRAARYVVARHAAALDAALGGASGRVRLVSGEEAHEAFPAVFELARRQRAGEVSRPEALWAARFDSGGGDHPSAARFFAAYVDRGRIDGYLIYEIPPSSGHFDERVVEVVELVATTDAAYQELWRFVLGLDLVGEITTGHRPVDEPLRHLLANPRALQVRALEDHTWLRLVDVATALTARRYHGAGALVLDLSDGQCAGNQGCFALVSDPLGRAAVERAEGPGDLQLDVACLAEVFLGGERPQSLAAAGRIRVRSPEALNELDRLLSSWPAPYCTADF